MDLSHKLTEMSSLTPGRFFFYFAFSAFFYLFFSTSQVCNSWTSKDSNNFIYDLGCRSFQFG